MTLQESYNSYRNNKSNYKGLLSYYNDKSSTPYQRLDNARQIILEEYQLKELQNQLDKELEQKLDKTLEQCLEDIFSKSILFK